MTDEERIEIDKIQGEVRGAVFQTDAHYIITSQGKTGLVSIEENLKNSGNNINYNDIKALEWLPMRTRIHTFLIMRDVFNWGDADFKKMGDSAPKHSFVIKLLSKFMISAQMTFKTSPEFWKKHHSTGRLVPQELNEKEGSSIIRIEDFLAHNLYCRYLEGYLSRIYQYIFPKEKINATETKCPHQGDPYHEFHFTW